MACGEIAGQTASNMGYASSWRKAIAEDAAGRHGLLKEGLTTVA
jgi:hypothetical protein